MTSVSAATVLYNNDVDQVIRLVRNISDVMGCFESFRFYLINNSPENDELTALLSTYSQNPNICVLTLAKNKGFGAGNNAIINQISSDYHFVINPDVLIDSSQQIRRMVDFMNINKEYGMLAPLIKFPNGQVQHLLKQEPSVFDMALRFLGLPFFNKRKQWFINLPDGYSYIHRAVNVPGSFMMFRTNLFKQIGGFDENYFLYMEDSDITMKINEVSEAVFFPNAFVYHEWQRQNRKSLKGIFQMISSMNKFFNKWGWKLW